MTAFNNYGLSKRSMKSLTGVDPRLVAIAIYALRKFSVHDFVITEGARSVERQKELVAAGASKTMNSKHIPVNGYAMAIDLYPAPIPEDLSKPPAGYTQLQKDVATAIKQAAKDLGYKITWGGDWKTFKDLPHFQMEE